MLKLLINNIGTSADENLPIIAVYQFIKFIITNSSAPYSICGSIIVMCMFATTLRNLIYKVLNLAVLSVFVVALWAYLTDVTFIYVVYILTFVSAVVMLFLSVVLMLPSSAIAVSKRNFLFILSSSASTSETGVVSTAANIATYIVYSCLIVIVVYFVVAFFKSYNTRHTYKHYGHPDLRCELTTSNDIAACTDDVKERMVHLINNYDFFMYSDLHVNRLAAQDCANTAILNGSGLTSQQQTVSAVSDSYVVEYGHAARPAANLLDANCLKIEGGHLNDHLDTDSSYPRYILAVPRLIRKPSKYEYLNKICNSMLLVVYEFINFYVHRIKRTSSYKLSISLRKFANTMYPSVENALFSPRGGRHSIYFYAGGDVKKKCYISFYTPWWSPFRVFNNPGIHNAAALGLSIHSEQVVPEYIRSLFTLCAALAAASVRALKIALHCVASQRFIFRMHPAVVIRLAETSLWPMFGAAAIYFRLVGYIFNYLEVPLSSKFGGQSMLKPFIGFYDSVVPAEPTSLVWHTNTVGEYTGHDMRCNKLIFRKNFIIFVIANLLFNIANVLVYVIALISSPVNIELAIQAVTTISIFFIALPIGITGTWAGFTYSFYTLDAGAGRFAENLAAIQQGLYVEQPFLLLVSITGLLVALIGAPFFVFRSK